MENSGKKRKIDKVTLVTVSSVKMYKTFLTSVNRSNRLNMFSCLGLIFYMCSLSLFSLHLVASFSYYIMIFTWNFFHQAIGVCVCEASFCFNELISRKQDTLSEVI